MTTFGTGTRSIYCVLFTANIRLVGHLSTTYGRLSDMLNVTDYDFLHLTDVVIYPLTVADRATTRANSIVFRKRDIILATDQVGDPASARQEVPWARPVADRTTVPVLVEAGPFRVEGTLHLLPGVPLVELVTNAERGFVPLTNAVVTHATLQTRSTTDFLLVNRRSITVFLEQTAIIEAASQPIADPGWLMSLVSGIESSSSEGPSQGRGLEPVSEPLSPSPQQDESRGGSRLPSGEALETVPAPHPTPSGIPEGEVTPFLLRSPLFQGADPVAVLEAAADLMRSGELVCRKYKAGAEVIVQGERRREGEALFILMDGSLEATERNVRADFQRSLATLQPGAVFGEVVTHGAGRYTIGVRATTEALVLVLSLRAWQALTRIYPPALRKLPPLIVHQRSAGSSLLDRHRSE